MPRRCSFKIELDFPQPLAGVDEAGCAPLAGPVVAAACILDRNKFPRGIDDSKNLPLERREALYAKITKVAAFGVGIASVEEIDSGVDRRFTHSGHGRSSIKRAESRARTRRPFRYPHAS